MRSTEIIALLLSLTVVFSCVYCWGMMVSTPSSKSEESRYYLILRDVKKKTLRLYGLEKVWRRGNTVRVKIVDKKLFPVSPPCPHYLIFLKREKLGWKLFIKGVAP